MSAAASGRDRAELARLGNEIIELRVQPLLGPEDDGKFVAVDIKTGKYEINADDYSAVLLLRSRCPEADLWLGRVGQPAAYRMRQVR